MGVWADVERTIQYDRWVVVYEVILSPLRAKLPNLCPWVSPQQPSSTRGEQRLFRFQQAPRSLTNSCKVGTSCKCIPVYQRSMRWLSSTDILGRWDWDRLHHGDVRRVSNWKDPVVPHTCCHMSGRVHAATDLFSKTWFCLKYKSINNRMICKVAKP